MERRHFWSLRGLFNFVISVTSPASSATEGTIIILPSPGSGKDHLQSTLEIVKV